MSAERSGSPAVPFGSGRSGPIRAALRKVTRDLELSPAYAVRVKLADALAGAADRAETPGDLTRASEKLLEVLDKIPAFASAPPGPREVGAGDGDGTRHLHGVMDSPPAVGD